MELAKIIEQSAKIHCGTSKININGELEQINFRNYITATEKKHIKQLVEYVINNEVTKPVKFNHRTDDWKVKKIDATIFVIRQFKINRSVRTHTFIITI